MAIFYRVVKTDPPTVRDFLSAKALGRPLRRDTPENRRIWDGISVLATADAARARVAQFPQMGTLIAVMNTSEDGSIPCEQTTPDPDHYTIWGSAADLLERVTSVLAV